MKDRLTFLIATIIFLVLMLNTAISYNYEYVNVTTTVNVTNAYPEILAIYLDQNILLNAGAQKTVYCNFTVRDWNGFDDINMSNATFWDNASVSFNDTDNANNHYTNTSCSEVNNDGQYIANWSCSFDVWYYANSGNQTWICNFFVMDNYNFTTEGLANTSILQYYAINVTNTIDFGNMVVGEIKNNITANVTNIGNSPINISVDGYGANNGDNLAMDCFVRNITISNLRYTTNISVWASATALTDTATNISNFSIPKRITSQTWNMTYWHLYIPPAENPFGVCNGTVVFTAWAG